MGQVDHELGAVGGEHVLADAAPVARPTDAVMRSQRSTGEPTGHPEQLGVVGASPRRRRCVCTAPPSSTSEQLVERRALDVGPGELGAELLGAPHRDEGERLAVGQVQPPDLAAPCRAPSTSAHARRGGARSAKSRMRRSRVARPRPASWPSMVPRRPRRLAQRVGGHEPAETLAGVDEALVAQHLERPADRDPAGLVVVRQLGLAGQQPPGAELARLDAGGAARRRSPGSGSWRTCLILVYIALVDASDPHAPDVHRPRTDRSEEPPWPSTANTPIELDRRRSTAACAERVALGRERLGRPLTFAEKVLVNHLARPREPGSSSGAAPTPTSTPTGSPCRTPPRRWRCCSS